MAPTNASRNRFTRLIRSMLLALGHMLGIHRSTSPDPQPVAKGQEARESGHAAEDARLQFKRAIAMLDLAVVHARYGFFDTARTNLSAAWDDLSGNRAARIQHNATVALVYACEGRVQQAAAHLYQAIDAYMGAYHALSPLVQRRIHQLCIQTMQHLPYDQQVARLTHDALLAREKEDYVTALRLLDQADQAYNHAARLITPRTNSHRLTAWQFVLEDMNSRGGRSTRAILDVFRSQQHAPASPLTGVAA